MRLMEITACHSGTQEVPTFFFLFYWFFFFVQYILNVTLYQLFFFVAASRGTKEPCPGGSVVSESDWIPGGCEFDLQLRQTSLPTYFRLSPLQKHVGKVVGGFWKKSCVSTGVSKPGNTMGITDHHDITLAVKLPVNLNATNNLEVEKNLVSQDTNGWERYKKFDHSQFFNFTKVKYCNSNFYHSIRWNL